MSILRFGGTVLCRADDIPMCIWTAFIGGGKQENVTVLVVIVVNEDGYREVLVLPRR